MRTGMSMRFNRVQRGLWPAIVGLYAILLTSLHMAMTSPWRLATPVKLANFEAAEPFQHRVLLPALVALIHEVMPLGIVLLFALAQMAAWVALILLADHALRWFAIGPNVAVRRMLALTVVIPVGLHLIVPELVPYPALNLDEGVIDLGNWRAQRLFYYVYDLPAAVFMLALVLLIVQYARSRDRRWLFGYLALFALATLNRETTAFLIPAFAAALYGVVDRGTLARAVLVQLATVLVIQATLQWWLFADQPNPNAGVPGTDYENHLLNNLRLFANPFYLLTFLARFGAGLYLPLIVLRRYLDPVLGRALLWFALPFLASAFLFGRIVEQRVVIELIPLLWLGGIQVLAAYNAARRSAGPSSELAPAALVAGGALPFGHARMDGLRQQRLGLDGSAAGPMTALSDVPGPSERRPSIGSARSAGPRRQRGCIARRRRRVPGSRTPTRSRPPASPRPDVRRWTP